MAAADYYFCDYCGCKCFYDAELNWKDMESIANEVRGHPGASLDMCGDIKAICLNCAKTHKCVVIEI